METREGNEGNLGKAFLAANQLKWFLSKMEKPVFQKYCSSLLPSLLTGIDHHSPLIKKPSLLGLSQAINLSSLSSLRWYGEVAIVATCHSLIGCEEDMWEVSLTVAVKLSRRIHGKDGRGKWYDHIMDVTISDMERRSDQKNRRLFWLKNGLLPLLDTMGLIIVAHFKRLLPLLCLWLRDSDDQSVLLVVENLKAIVKNTWPRIWVHKKRLMEALENCHKEAEVRKNGKVIKESIENLFDLLKQCPIPDTFYNKVDKDKVQDELKGILTTKLVV